MLYDVPESEIKFEQEKIEELKDYSIIKITSPSYITTGYANNDTNIAYLYMPNELKHNKVIVLIHGMGSRNVRYLKYFGHAFAKKGVPLMMQILPFHNERKIENAKDGIKFLQDDIDESLRDFRQAVIDARANMNFLESLGLATSGFSTIGFSFGGMIATILTAVDKRVDSSLLVVTGGNYQYITWESLATKLIRNKYETESDYESYGCNYKKCIELHKNYNETLSKIHSAEDIEKMEFPKGCYLFDPLTFAPLIKGRQVVIVRAIFDEIFPKESTLELKNAIGTAKMINIFADHYTAILYRHMLFKIAYNLFIEGK